MYRCFNLSIQKENFLDQLPSYIDECRNEGRTIKANLQRKINDVLNNVTNPNGIIDGGALADTWFPIESADVFLSYSHNDEDLALIITGILKKNFGLSVFMDALTWGSADGLLKSIDDRYCRKSNGTYDYEKRNFSTSHVHALLTGAVMRAMDQTEAVFFLNTENSTYQLDAGFGGNHTPSPWIFEEILVASMLRRRDWTAHRRQAINEMTHFQKNLEIAYPLCTDSFTELSFSDVLSWAQLWKNRKDEILPYGGIFPSDQKRIKHALNVLYEFKFGVE